MSAKLNNAGLLWVAGIVNTLLLGCSSAQSVIRTTTATAATAVEVVAAVDALTVSPEEERQIGDKMALAIEDSIGRSAGFWPDDLLTTYVTDLTDRLVAVADSGPDYYQVRIVNDPSVNAFAVPGGHIFVHAGLIARVESEAQLAMVLAHEIAHVTERHWLEGMQETFGAQLATGFLKDVALETGTLQGRELAVVHHYTTLAAISGFSKGNEAEADRTGLRYMAAAGLDPNEAPGVFRVLYEEHGDESRVKNFFWGTHPLNSDRYNAVSRLVAGSYPTQANRRWVVNTEDFKRSTRDVVIAIGILDVEAGRLEKAVEMFEKAAAVQEDDPVPHFYLGKIALNPGAPGGIDQAILHLARATVVDPQYAPAYRELGHAYYRKRDRDRGIAALERYLNLVPDAEDADQVRRMIAQLRRY